MKCQLCEKIFEQNNEHFMIAYFNKSQISSPTLNFCCECFISLSGIEWANRCGYKSKKVPEHYSSQFGTTTRNY